MLNEQALGRNEPHDGPFAGSRRPTAPDPPPPVEDPEFTPPKLWDRYVHLYGSALGSRRIEVIEQHAMKLLLQDGGSARHERLAARAKQLELAFLTLNRPFGELVVELERLRAVLGQDLDDKDAWRRRTPDESAKEFSQLQKKLGAVERELAEVEKLAAHPDKWLDKHKQEVAEALADMAQFKRERRRTDRVPERLELGDFRAPDLSQAAREPTGGRGFD
jgi:hypothetical protein